MSVENGPSTEWDELRNLAESVRTGKDCFRDELTNPAAFKIVGDVIGKHVLDLSCWEGYNTRILANGGAKVGGIDFPERTIDLARQLEKRQKLGVSYYVSDAADLKRFESKRFDVVTCLMALMDIERYEDAISGCSSSEEEWKICVLDHSFLFRWRVSRGFLAPKPTSRGVSEHPSLRKHTKIPHSIIIKTISS